MRTGVDYWDSSEKRAFDMLLANALRPALWGAHSLLRATVDSKTPSSDLIYRQKRIGGALGTLFEIEKIETLDAAGLPLNRLAALYRKLTIDELAQVNNIVRGEMAVCSWRPIQDCSTASGLGRDEVIDVMNKVDTGKARAWEQMTYLVRPGWVSTNAMAEHTTAHGTPREVLIPQRVDNDLYDLHHDSLASNVKLCLDFAQLAAERRFQ